MTESTQTYLALENGSTQTNLGFQSVLNYIRENARSERQKGDLFEQLMQKYFTENPDYKEQFSEVYLWKQWAQLRTEFDGTDIGVDLVAQKHDGEFCAIQCKCYAETTRISKGHIDSFISASASEIFTSRIFVNTGGELGENALRTITPLGDKFRIIRFSDLESSPFDWPDLSLQDPAELTYKQRRFHLKDHQDEAHRTTGVDKPGDKTSPFVLVHDEDRIRANKRLYMTATPRLYTENARKKAADYNADVFSMDDEEKYGPQFHWLPFSKAVELGELSDYKVAIFGISEHEVNAKLAGNTGKYGSEININDATRIIGCWRALQNPENKQKDDETLRPLKRVIAFTNRIDESKALARYWNNIIEDAIEKLPEDEQPTNFLCEGTSLTIPLL